MVEHDDGGREQTRVIRVRWSDASITPRRAVRSYIEAGVAVPPRITISPSGVFPLIGDDAE